MDFSNFSLLYPTLESQRSHHSGEKVPDIDMFVLDELSLLDCFDLHNRELCEFVTTDPEVIRYRMDTFRDMLENESISKTLNRLIPILGDIMELRRLEADSGEAASYLSSITEIELYISSIDTLHAGLSMVRQNLKGKALTSLADRIAELADSEYYRELNEKLNELTNRVRDVKSVTVGVNLDAQLRPCEAGVLSINPEPFRSGDVLEKILRLNFKDDEYTCIAQLVPFGKKQTENQKTALSLAFTSAINDVYKTSLRSWKKIVQAYVLENTDFLLNLMPEIEFFVKGTDFLRTLRDKGCALCTPDIRPMEEHTFTAKELYNPCVALKITDPIVTNDLDFDEKATIYVITGPNRGGKSVITCAAGQAQVMLQLGMFIPAEEAAISPVDAIFTHFPSGADDTIDKGRLGEECDRLREIFDVITPESLVLMDESFSSTGAYEASYIAAEVLSALSYVGCRCIFSTHLHQLAAELDSINEKAAKSGGAPIDTLVAGMETGQRSFKILRKKPDGKSYARDIAEKYGITYDTIITKFDNRTTEKENNNG
jgi:DNA mismatch repair ATPase MutS